MEQDIKKLYAYARQRIRQKKKFYFHFVLFLCGCLLMFVTAFIEIGLHMHWYFWIGSIWFIILILHFVKVYIRNRFMNKDWENDQIERLVSRQKNRIQQLESKIQLDPEQNNS